MTDNQDGFSFDDVSVNDLLASSSEDVDTNQDDSNDGTDTSSEESSEDDEQQGPDANDSDNDNPNDTTEESEEQQESEEEGEEGEEEEGDEEPSVIEELSSLTGFEFEEEEFTEDVKGIADYTKKVGQKIGETYIKEVFEAFPDVQQYLKYRSEGGDPEKYFELSKKTTQYNDLTEDTLKDDVGLQKSVVRDMFSKMGYSEEDINETIKDLEDSELLLKQAVKSSARLGALAQQEQQAELQRQAELKEQAKQEERQTWKEISDTIARGELKGFIVPETDKKQFYDWMTKPVDAKGNTQRSIAMNEMDVESTLALEYLYFKKFDLGKMAKSVSATARNRGLRSRLNGKSNSPARAFAKGSKGGNQRASQLPELKDVL